MIYQKLVLKTHHHRQQRTFSETYVSHDGRTEGSKSLLDSQPNNCICLEIPLYEEMEEEEVMDMEEDN